jgi:hypothetical protein
MEASATHSKMAHKFGRMWSLCGFTVASHFTYTQEPYAQKASNVSRLIAIEKSLGLFNDALSEYRFYSIKLQGDYE